MLLEKTNVDFVLLINAKNISLACAWYTAIDKFDLYFLKTKF